MFKYTQTRCKPFFKQASVLCLSVFLSACVIHVNTQNYTNSVVNQVEEIEDLSIAVQKAASLPIDSTLVVFDIDDTLLTASEFFGSDKWYDWQRGRALDTAGETLSISDQAKAMCLFDTLGMAFEMATNVPTQPNMLNIVKSVKNDILVLTARSDSYRSATMRELKRNGLDFSQYSFLPDDLAYHYDFTFEGRTAQVSYVDGVFMVKGMNKGVMLLDLLEKTDREYDNIVFVDDKTHNIDNMGEALADAGINYYGFHYTKINKRVTSEEVAEAQHTLVDLQALLEAHFTDRAKLLNRSQCDY